MVRDEVESVCELDCTLGVAIVTPNVMTAELVNSEGGGAVKNSKLQPIVVEDSSGNTLVIGVHYDPRVQLVWRKTVGWTRENLSSLSHLFSIEEDVSTFRFPDEIPYPPVRREDLRETSPIEAVQKALGNCTVGNAQRYRKRQGWKTYRQLGRERNVRAVQTCKRQGLSQLKTAKHLSLAISTVASLWRTEEDKRREQETEQLWASWTATKAANHYRMRRNAELGIRLCREIERYANTKITRAGQRRPFNRVKIAKAAGVSEEDVGRWAPLANEKCERILTRWLEENPPCEQPPYFSTLVDLLGGEEALHRRIPFRAWIYDYTDYTPSVYTLWNPDRFDKWNTLPPTPRQIRRMEQGYGPEFFGLY